MGIFLYYPFFMNFYKSFFDWDGFFYSKFIGLGNYKRLIHDPIIKTAAKNTFILMFFVCIIQVGLGLLFAILVDSIKVGSNFFKTVFFFPVVISATAIGLLFKLFYVYEGGLLNSIRTIMGKEPVIWLSEEKAMGMVSIPIIWQYIGFYFVILLTAIKRIPKELYECAQLDGINGFTKTFYITIPLIWDMIKVCLILAITGTLKVFDIVFVITQGGPMGTTELFSTYMYQKTFTDNRFGYGSTIAVLIVVLGVVISLLLDKLLKREEITY